MKSYFKILIAGSQILILVLLLLNSFISKSDNIANYKVSNIEKSMLLDPNEIPVDFKMRFPVLGLNKLFYHYQHPNIPFLEIEIKESNFENIDKPLHQAHHTGISQYLYEEKNQNQDFEIIKIRFK